MPQKVERQTEFRNVLEAALKKSSHKTLAALARAAEIPIASISMALSGRRSLSHKATVQLAKALLPANEDWQRLAQQLLNAANKNIAKSGALKAPLEMIDFAQVGSVADRVRLRRVVRAGYIVNPPFVSLQGKGFAIDFYEHLVRVMGFSPTAVPIEFGVMGEKLSRDEVDIVVTALLPTFQRSTFMSFSPPLPYLKVPLSGLLKCGRWKDLNIEHLLNAQAFRSLHPDDRHAATQLFEAKILFVKGEVGEEFARAFFDPELMSQLQRTGRLFNPSNQTPSQLAETLIDNDIDVFIADIATCRSVMDALDLKSAENRYEPLKDPLKLLPMEPLKDPLKLLPVRSQPAASYWQFASYPVVFGIKKGDTEWEDMVKDAFASLMTEGIRAVLSLYARYDDAKRHPDFHTWYFDPSVETETMSSLSHEHFQEVFSKTVTEKKTKKKKNPDLESLQQ